MVLSDRNRAVLRLLFRVRDAVVLLEETLEALGEEGVPLGDVLDDECFRETYRKLQMGVTEELNDLEDE